MYHLIERKTALWNIANEGSELTQSSDTHILGEYLSEEADSHTQESILLNASSFLLAWLLPSKAECHPCCLFLESH